MTAIRGGFVRIPSSLLDYLLTLQFSASELRIVLWVIRRTLGWNRHTTLFTWYQIAKDLDLDRSGVLRAGKALLSREVLTITEGRIGVKGAEVPLSANGSLSGDARHRMTTTDGDDRQRKQGLGSPLYRRAIDSSKDKTIYVVQPYGTSGRMPTALHPAGAAQPIAGKYDDISTI